MNEYGPNTLGRYTLAWLFDASCDGGANNFGIQVHTDFTEAEAASAAQKYGKDVGRLPKVLRTGIGGTTGIRIVSIHKGSHNWYASGRLGEICVYTEHGSKAYHEEVLVHEAAHVSLDDRVISAPRWLAAQKADAAYISTYARNYPQREDVAESFLAYFAARYVPSRISRTWEKKIFSTIPNRIAWFDTLLSANDMKPFTRTSSRVAGLVVDASRLKMDAGGTATYDLRLPAPPDADVTVTPASSDEKVATVSGPFTFTASNWHVPQTVTVTGAGGGAASISHTSASSDGDYKLSAATLPGIFVAVAGNPVSLSVSGNGAGAEGGSALTVTAALKRANATGAALAIPVRVRSAGTTAATGDYGFADTISIPDGAGSGTADFTVVDDSEDEPGETVVIELGSPLPAGFSAGTADHVTIAITDNDATAVTLTVPDTTASEGDASDTASIALTLNRGLVAGESLAVPLAFAGGALGTEFTLSAPSSPPAGVSLSGSTVTFAGPVSGTGAASVTLTLGVVADALASDRTVTVSIPPSSTGTGAKLTATGLDGGAEGARTGDGRITLKDSAPIEPVVTVSAGNAVTEGGDAAFTLTATPAPTADLPVSVTVATDGDYGVTAGPRTVTIPTTGSATLTLTTSGDEADEADGSVTVTVTGGDGYTVGSSASGSVTVRDDDEAVGPDWTDYQTVVNRIIEVRDNPENAAVRGHPVHIAKWNRVLEAIGYDTGTGVSPMPASEIHANAARWPESTFKAASVYLKSLEAQPVVTVSAGSAVTEGGDATFTLTATPAPAADLAVSVTVATNGDWGVTAGPRTVSIPTTGSATLTLSTTGDDADEPDGSVTVTVTDGAGYTVGSSASGSVTVRDDDEAGGPDWTDFQTVVDRIIEARDNPTNAWAKGGGNAAHVAKWNRVLEAIGYDTGTGVSPMAASEIHANAAKWPQSTFKAASVYLKSLDDNGPVVTVSAGVAVTEGAGAGFTVRRTGDTAAALTVKLAVSEDGTGGRDFVAAGEEGDKEVVIGAGSAEATYTVPTGDDAADEPDGTVTLALRDDSAYTSGSPSSATVTVRDNDGAPPLPVVTVSGGDAVTEGGSATFTLTATPPPAAALAVSVSVTAAGEYGISAGPQTVTLPTTGSAVLTLATTGDDVDEADGSVSVTVTDAAGYTVGDPASGSVAVRDDDVPVVTVSGGDAVTEGDSATFTLTASPTPAAALAVRVTIATAGEYGISAGSRTVTLPTTGSTTLSLPTTDDATDEPDGSVTATVETGAGYTAGNPASGTVALLDDDLPPPVVTIAAQASPVTEGGDAVFTLTADRAPAAALTVKLSVAETGTGDHVAAADEGPASVVIAKGETEAVFRLATVNDEVDEPDTSAVVTVEAGAGYTVGTPSSGTVTVADDDTASLPALSVADVTAREGVDWMLTFTVRLSAPAPETVEVRVDTRASTPVSAEPGHDYIPAPVGGHRVVFRAGETERPVQVIVLDDSHDEEAETFELVLSEAQGATIGDGVAVGTITNDDPMPAAWLARFGRTVAEQALDGIAHRMAAPRTPGMRGTVAGLPLDFGAPAGGAPGAWSGAGAGNAAAGSPALAGTGALALADVAQAFGGHGGIDDDFGHDAAGIGNGFGETHAQSTTVREALLGSRFTLTGQEDSSGGTAAFWGRASQGNFDGREGTFSLDGTVTTGMLGADYARGRWLFGLALAQSEGEGEYRDTKETPRPPSQTCPADAEGADAELCRNAVRAGDGRVEASLTAALPYASVQASERLKLWGAVGYGSGEVTLETALGGSYTADTTWRMAAAGLRGDVLAPAGGSGPALALTSDALWTRTSSEKTRDLAASDSGVTRLRLGLEGSWRMALDGGSSLTPKLELGARRDGGDAETGFGVELGGGVAWSDPALGLSLDVSGRTLIAHEDDALEDRGVAASLGFDPDPATQRGPSLSLRQEFGARATGGLDALFAPDPLEDRTGGEAASRWTMEAAYGLPAFGGRWTASPHVGLGLSGAARDYTLGWRLAPEAANAPDLTFGVRATRRESDTAEPEHTVGFEAVARW